jgi:hypothetical protein
VKTSLPRIFTIVALLAALFAVGFVARQVARAEPPRPVASLPIELIPWMALPLVHVLLR